jgi:8-oxo-dGTP pyrophosphatase MutT (NUDIX family)
VSAARRIHLRRPPTLSVVDEPFVPDVDAARLDEVDQRWDALRAANDAYFDGRLYHVLGVHRNGHGGAVLHVADCAYRFYAVQSPDFELGVRPLGVKGITGHGGRVLMGRRAASVSAYAGRWEFAPGGGVEPGDPPSAQPARTLLAELREETGRTARREPTPIAILFDDVLGTWEIVYRIDATRDGVPATAEYDELTWCAPGALPEDLTPIGRQMVALL